MTVCFPEQYTATWCSVLGGFGPLLRVSFKELESPPWQSSSLLADFLCRSESGFLWVPLASLELGVLIAVLLSFSSFPGSCAWLPHPASFIPLPTNAGDWRNKIWLVSERLRSQALPVIFLTLSWSHLSLQELNGHMRVSGGLVCSQIFCPPKDSTLQGIQLVLRV